MIGTVQMRYPDYDVYERLVTGTRHHETRCRWCDWRSGWLARTFEGHEAVTQHLVNTH